MAGVYKDTLIQNLEIETHCPLLDLYLNKQVANFKNRTRRANTAQILQTISNRMVRQLQHR